MQKSYDRITIPKIVVCSKSALDDGVQSDECGKKSTNQRRIVRSRNRRHSRRFSLSIVDRRSPSSSRSPSPSIIKSKSQGKDCSDENTIGKQDSERDALSQIDIRYGKSEGTDEDCKSEEITAERLRNEFFDREDKEEGGTSSLRNVAAENCRRRISKCDKCGNGEINNKNESCLENCSGYQQYLMLLVVPQATLEWGEASGDDLSSEWDSDHTERSNERKTPKVTIEKADPRDNLPRSFCVRVFK